MTVIRLAEKLERNGGVRAYWRIVASAPRQVTQNQSLCRRRCFSSSSIPRPRNRPLPQKQHHSTSTMDFANSCPSILTNTDAVAKPTKKALQTLFVASAIPMVGFGFMDNFVMIQAGQYIDSTLGVSLGLATMTAAAAGQVVSDVSGVVFGGTLERFLTKMKLIQAPSISTAQRQLPICRNVAMAGAVIGVIVGCALGATTLLFVDLEARDKIQRAQNLREVVQEMIAENSVSHFPCRSCTVYVAAAEDFTLPEKNDGNTTLIYLQDASSSAVSRCADKREMIIADDRHTMYTPVLKKNDAGKDDLAAVVAFQYGESRPSSDGFCDEDVLTARVMARHIAIFMDRLVD